MLRDFQAIVQSQAFEAWSRPNVFNVGINLPTGGGKTVLMGDTITKMDRPTCAIAHRRELVSQISLALNRENVYHDIYAPRKIQQQIIRLHHETYGYSRYKHRSHVRVAGVDSLRNPDEKDRWFSQVGLAIIDEAHHVLRSNKWGKAFQRFPNALGLFLTAHFYRADNLGLGRVGSGLVDEVIIGPSCRQLINRGYLTDYDVYCPKSDIDFSGVEISDATGDLNQAQLQAVTHASKQLVSNAVDQYLFRTPGKLGVTFVVDTQEAAKTCEAFNKAGVPAQVITAKTDVTLRGNYMRQFRERKLLQLISVDCLGEGVDVPAIETVILARRTASFQVLAQQVGRSLRPMVSDAEARAWGTYDDVGRIQRISASEKPKATVIDLVGNIAYLSKKHGRPCSPQIYIMADAPKSKPKARPDSLKTCIKCLKPYELFYTQCPYCGHIPVVAGRSLPEEVDGDIVLLDPAVLDRMQAEIDRVNGPPPSTSNTPTGGAILKNHRQRQEAQAALRRVMSLWGGWREHLGENTREAHKRFYLTFGVDVMSAQILGVLPAYELQVRIQQELNVNNIVEAAA
jgi:DNA repair protein RadD